ncbi:transketolase [Nocardioides aquiterrae]|uniref:Transketolase n=1 Tax=Nocardioides aquiterrae TaxID=203799 RepID=A0ABN1UFS2_9ACTN
MTELTSSELSRKIRQHVLRMTHHGRSSHVASGLSVADILASLYGEVLRVDPSDPDWLDRDRFVMSKGHAGAAVYAALSETGFFSPESLAAHYQNGSTFSGHVSHVGVPGVEVSTGSLGHGLSIATGMAWRARAVGAGWRAYALLSDGECDEGSTWEAALFAGHHRMSNLIAVIDYNKYQSLATTDETLTLEPFADKWVAFGWDVIEVDGHDIEEISAGLDIDPRDRDRPRCVIAHTIKGKGVSFMENNVLWHYRPPSDEELALALAEVSE